MRGPAGTASSASTRHPSTPAPPPSRAMAPSTSCAAVPLRGLGLLLTAVIPLALTAPSAAAAARACTYTLRVKTSCASPAARTSDAVGVAFGDAYRNEAHAPRLPTSGSGGRALERCGTDTFRVPGPCGYGVCYLYLRRDGRDGWAPEWVQVVQPGPRAPAAATFYFGDPLPDGVWYGHDRCPKAKAKAAGADGAAENAARPAATADAGNSSASPRG